MALYIEIKSADGMVSRTKLDAGRNRFTVRLGDNYRIVDDQTGLTPEGIAVKRVDNNLVVDRIDAQGSTVEFAEYYNICSAGSPCALTVDHGGGSQPVVITPGTQPIGALSDGAFVLYDPSFADTAPAAPSMSDGTALRYGLYGLGGLAVAGLAAGGGGGGGGDGGGGGGGTRPDGSLKLTSSEFVNSRTPVITGEGEPGSRVIVRIDTDGDGSPNVTYATTVGADFKWSINLATAVPESGALPAGGLPDQSNVGITSATSAGNASLATFVMTYDGVAPDIAGVDLVAGDNTVNLAEKTSGVAVSGSAEAGATVIVSWGTQVRTAEVGTDGRWQTPTFDTASIPGDGASTITVVVQDRAGNNSPPRELAVTVNTAPPVLTLVPGNEQINGTTAATGITFQGQTDPGGRIDFSWNGVARPAVTADGSGHWQIAVASGEIPAANGSSVPYAIAATSLAGNTATLAGHTTVDTVPPAAPGINAVTGDNLVTLVDNPAAGISVTGTAEPGATVNVNWGGKVASGVANASSVWTAVFASGNLPADGAHPLSAVATDPAGNPSTAATLPTVTVDVTPPPLTVTAISADNLINAAEATAGVSFSGTTEAGATISVTWNGATLPGTVGAGGAWSTGLFAAPATSAPTGTPVSATIVATDAHGNPAQTTQVITVDVVAPAPAAGVLVDLDNEVSTGQQFGVTGTAEAGASVTVTIGATSANVTAGLDGAWATSATAFVGGVPGPGSATVTVADIAGNTSAVAAPFNIILIGAVAPPDQIGGAAASWSAAETLTSLTPIDDHYA